MAERRANGASRARLATRMWVPTASPLRSRTQRDERHRDLNITVINVNDAPTFTANPINKSNATQDAAYSDTLAGSATDIDAGDYD